MSDAWVTTIKAKLAKIEDALREARAEGDADAATHLAELIEIGRSTLTLVRGGRLETNDAQDFFKACSRLETQRPDLAPKLKLARLQED